MHVAITGVAGGIGVELAKKLIESNHEVRGLDNLSNPSHLFDSLCGVRFMKADLVDESERTKILDFLSPADAIVHLAGVSSLPECEKNPEIAFQTNFLATVALARYCMKSGKRFVFASTSAVYENTKSKILEESMPVKPDLVYAQSKLFSERYLESLFLNYGYRSTCLRLFNVFSPSIGRSRKQPPLVNYLFRELSEGRHPEVFAPHDQCRDYISIGDVVEAFVRSLEIPEADFRLLNVASGIQISVGQILAAVSQGAQLAEMELSQKNPEEMWDAHAELHTKPHPLDRSRVEREVLKGSLGSTKKITRTLGWTPQQNVLNEISEFSKALMRNENQ